MADSFFFLTDGPPLRENATGNHGIAANFIDILSDRLKLVITHRFRRSFSPREIQEGFPAARIEFYPDSGAIGLKRIVPNVAEFVDMLGAWLYSHRLRRLASEQRPARMFVLVGGNGWFLVSVWLLTQAVRLPFDIYLVDDLEDSATLWMRPLLPRFIRQLEGAVLRRASRVFAISPGYAEHLAAKYGVRAEWLPTPIQLGRLVYQPFQRTTPDVRSIVFAGGISALYISALVELYRAIQAFNARHNRYRLRLTIIAPVNADPIPEQLPDTRDLEVVIKPSRAELDARCAGAWATILPYSFDANVRKLVSTSFSWKLSDSYRSGRPILVYGPEYASIPRYFQEAGLPLCATSTSELHSALESIEEWDGPELIALYERTWRRHHSAEAIRERLRAATHNSDA